MMTDPNSCYLSTRTQKTQTNTMDERMCPRTHTHTNAHIDRGDTHKHAQKQRAHPEPSNVDSDPAIFKGHTSQDIISSSFVLRELCLFTQHTHTQNGRHTRVSEHCIVTHKYSHTHAHSRG